MAKKERQYACLRCKNTRTESYCSYCSWKGWEGPGKQLLDIIAAEKGRTMAKRRHCEQYRNPARHAA